MKVLQVSTHVNIGGIGNYVLSLSEALVKKGSSVIVASSGGVLEKEFGPLGIKACRIDIDTKNEFSPKVFWSAFAISRIIKGEKIDIIHAHSRVSQVASAIASKMTGTPYITTCHGYFKKRLRGIIDTWGTKVIAISDAVRSHLIDDLGVSNDRIRLVYNGIDLARFAGKYSPVELDNIRSSLDLIKGPVIGTIGRLSSVKGQKYLVEAMADLVTHVPEIKAIIVGDGPEEENLTSLALSLDIEDGIRFITSNVNTLKFLSVMDVFVFPSLKEGLGLALLEAMAAGKACVASNVGGIADIIKDGSNGMLVEPGNWRSISDAVLQLLNNSALREKMGENARAIVRERFGMDRMINGITEVYREAISAK